MKINPHEFYNLDVSIEPGESVRINLGDDTMSVCIGVSRIDGGINLIYSLDWVGENAQFTIGNVFKDAPILKMRNPVAVALHPIDFPSGEDLLCEVGQRFQVLNYVGGWVSVVWTRPDYTSYKNLEVGVDVEVIDVSREEYDSLRGVQ